ncbi:unnamed protein product [Calicophoron daubneyi]|uniref:Large ribosomal subunit protein mL40 n=1 Tax=Calicophoron daubneyi TaxID=300641 RepID=A0AAV2T3G2_CALDB
MLRQALKFTIQPCYFTEFVSRVNSGLHTSASLLSEPLKKKKRIDPAVEQARIKRKARRIEKEIRRFTRQDRQLKPIAEIEGDRQLLKELETRRRPPIDLSENEVDRRELLMKEWTRHQKRVAHVESCNIINAIRAQQRALDWLYITNPRLYREAIQPCPTVRGVATDTVNPTTLPTEKIQGPYHTAPRMCSELLESTQDYDPPDGEIADSTPVFDYEFEIDRQFQAEPKKKKLLLRRPENEDAADK